MNLNFEDRLCLETIRRQDRHQPLRNINLMIYYWERRHPVNDRPVVTVDGEKE